MRLSYFFVVATITLLTGTASAISATGNDIATSILSTAENQQHNHRSLRTGTLPQEKEERTVDLKKVTDIVDDTGYKFVDKLKRSKT
ncbi:RxLR effector protein, partial [Phytophthora megakarya]